MGDEGLKSSSLSPRKTPSPLEECAHLCATSEASHLFAEIGRLDAWANLPQSVQREITALSPECLAALWAIFASPAEESQLDSPEDASGHLRRRLPAQTPSSCKDATLDLERALGSLAVKPCSRSISSSSPARARFNRGVSRSNLPRRVRRAVLQFALASIDPLSPPATSVPRARSTGDSLVCRPDRQTATWNSPKPSS